MSHTSTRATATRFGALCTAVAGRIQAAGEGAAQHGASAPAALIALQGHSAGGSIDALRRVLGITHSGAVRLVDRLAAAGLVERRVGADGRAVSLFLTPTGRRTARRALAAREAAIEDVLRPLAPADRERLGELLDALLGELPEGRPTVCRLCDMEACGACPVPEARSDV